MIRQMIRTAAAAVAGAFAAAVCLTIALAWGPELAFEMDRDVPRQIATGVYPAERAGDLTFVWTSSRADITIDSLNREQSWACTVRFRGARGEPLPQPVVEVAIDGLTLDRRPATNEFQDVEVTAPARPSRPGLTLSIASSTTVVPGPSDRRELGVQLDRVACRPAGAGIMLPPRRALAAGMGAGAVFAAVFVLAGATFGGAALAAIALTAAQSFPLSTGAAPYSGFPDAVVQLSLWVAGLTLAGVKLLEAATGGRLRSAARFVVLFSACALYLKLLGLLHPSKLLIDALFHAHRFQSVLAGGYYFTQPMPGGVSFPYAIGLYLFAAPWSALTRDYVTLLRVVVAASEVAAGALLYLAIVRNWGDRATGALAVVLFNLVPLPYGLVGNANLTNAFGQSVALATVATAAIWRLGPTRHAAQIIGLFLLASLALLSHISTAALLGVTLVALAILYRFRGGRPLHAAGWSVLAVTLAAALFSIVTYYGHFTEVYRTVARVRGAPPAATAGPGSGPEARPPEAHAPAAAVTPLPARIAHALRFTGTVVGWPILILAVAGLWPFRRMGEGDRLSLALVAWGIAYAAFLGVGVARVDAQFERYAAEFVGRVVFATYPAAVVLAARGAIRGWRAGAVPRIGSLALLVWAVVIGVQQWARWLE